MQVNQNKTAYPSSPNMHYIYIKTGFHIVIYISHPNKNKIQNRVQISMLSLYASTPFFDTKFTVFQ